MKSFIDKFDGQANVSGAAIRRRKERPIQLREWILRSIGKVVDTFNPVCYLKLAYSQMEKKKSRRFPFPQRLSDKWYNIRGTWHQRLEHKS
jgi:hypothetical protein